MRDAESSFLELGSDGVLDDVMAHSLRDGTTHIVLEPLDFIARLAALVPPSRAHLTRCHGVFAAHAAGARRSRQQEGEPGRKNAAHRSGGVRKTFA